MLLVIVHRTGSGDDDRERDEEAHRADERLRQAVVGDDFEGARRIVAVSHVAAGVRFQDLDKVLGRRDVQRERDVDVTSRRPARDARFEIVGLDHGLLASLVLVDDVFLLALRLGGEFGVVVAQLHHHRVPRRRGSTGPRHVDGVQTTLRFLRT